MKVTILLIPAVLALGGCVSPDPNIADLRQPSTGATTITPVLTEAAPQPQQAASAPVATSSPADTVSAGTMTISDAPAYTGGGTSDDPVVIKLN